MHSYGRRTDEETGATHARVSQAHTYDLVTILWSRRIGNGTLDCQLLRASSGPAKRLVQLRCEYTEGNEDNLVIVQVKDTLEEAREAFRLERLMLHASIQPTKGEPLGKAQ